MLLHEAVLKARTDLGLSQKKLAELAGIQRKQLATLEKGGNITLATLRKILAHLPNLETFALDAVTATVQRSVPPEKAVVQTRKAAIQLSEALGAVFSKIAMGQPVGESDVEAFNQAADAVRRGYALGEEVQDREIAAELAFHRSNAEEAFRLMAMLNRKRRKKARPGAGSLPSAE